MPIEIDDTNIIINDGSTTSNILEVVKSKGSYNDPYYQTIEYDAQWTYSDTDASVYHLGNVGIGTEANSAYSLNVAGDVNVNGDLYYNNAKANVGLLSNYVYTNEEPSIVYETETIERMYPPVRNFTQNTGIVSGQSYGNGEYIASASSFYGSTESPYYFVDGTSSGWTPNDYKYGTGSYTGSMSLAGYAGEWIKFKLPVQIKLTKYILQVANISGVDRPERAPSIYKIFGSNDNTNWTELVFKSTPLTTSSYVSGIFEDNVSTSGTYSYFALVVNKNMGNVWMSIGEWTLYGKENETSSVPPQIPADNYQYHILTFEGTSGSLSTDGNHRIHNINFPENVVADILIVGGGGGGGHQNAGGGGAGGLVLIQKFTTNGTYNIKVGKGGNGGINQSRGENGANTTFTKTDNSVIITANGGGGGASTGLSGQGDGLKASNGGSGGGGGYYLENGIQTQKSQSQIGIISPATLNQFGEDGGHGGGGTSSYPGGGGGGAGGVGATSSTNDTGQNGGKGIDRVGTFVFSEKFSSSIGHNGWFAGGGGSGGKDLIDGYGNGGINLYGGGGNGDNIGGRINGINGTGGGGGSIREPGTDVGGNGGSGIVIIRYYYVSSITHKYLALTHQPDYITSVQLKAEQITGVIGWKLVRYKPISNLWFSGNNNLQGTYQLNHTTKLPTQEWAITWNDATENEVLFVKGDFVSWLRCNASSLDVLDWTNPTALGGNKLTDGKFTMYRNESTWQTSPYIFDHSVDYQNAYGDMIYSEYSEVGYLNIPGATWPNPDMPEYYGTENYEYYVLVRNSGATSSIPSNTTYTLNVPEDTSCEVLVINNTQAHKATGLTLNGTYNVIVGSDSRIEKDGVILHNPNSGLSITDSITGASIQYTANNPIVIIRYSLGNRIYKLSNWEYSSRFDDVYYMGSVAIGKDNASYAVDLDGLPEASSFNIINVNGTITSSSKNFKIEHPIVSNMYLYHGCIEGPRFDNMYRGKKLVVGGYCEVDIDTECNNTGGMTPGTFVALNGDSQLYLQNNQTFDKVRGYIENGKIKIFCINTTKNIMVDWLVIGERHDKDVINTTITNTSGKLICEQ